MSQAFDPYHLWLGIPPAEQPPNHYRLLGIALLEGNADVIATAADRQMAHLRTFQSGKHSALSQRLLNEVAAAKVVLLTPAKKTVYDEQLRERLEPRSVAHAGNGKMAGRVPFAAETPAPRPAADKEATPNQDDPLPWEEIAADPPFAVRREGPAAEFPFRPRPVALPKSGGPIWA